MLLCVAGALVVFAVTFAVFIPTLSADWVNYDDPANYLVNENYRGLDWPRIQWMFSTFHMGHYQPLAWLTLGLDYTLHGMDARGYHRTSLFLHAFTAVFVFLLALRLLTCSKSFSARPVTTTSLAVFAALFFSVHPLRVETVAWLTQRRDLVSAFFLVPAVLAYCRAAATPVNRPARWWWYGLSILFFALSLLGKVAGVPLVVILLALDWFPLNRLGTRVRDLFSLRALVVYLEKLPFAILAFVFARIAVRGQTDMAAQVSTSVLDAGERFAIAMYGLVWYMRKTFLPFELKPLYYWPPAFNTPAEEFSFIDSVRRAFDADPAFLANTLIVAAVAVLILTLSLIGRGRAIVVALIAYAAMLSPRLGLFHSGAQIVADRYSYLPAIPVAILLAALVMWLLHRPLLAVGFRAVVARIVIAIALIGTIAALSTLTWKQCAIWKDADSLMKVFPSRSRGR